MKKLLILAGLLLATVAGLNAQRPSWGIKAGYNSSGVQLSIPESDRLNSFHAGFLTDLPVNRRIGFRVELNYSREGAFREYSIYNGIADIEYSDKLRLNYFNIPVLLSISPAKWLTFHAGPQVGLLINHVEIAENKSSKKSEREVNPVYKAVNMSFVLDLQINFTRHFSIYGRYNLGLSNIIPDTLADVVIRSDVIQAGIAVRF